MKMVTRTAIANMKYHKSKNILTGIAIFLTSVLLFLVPSIGFAFMDTEFTLVSQTYPTWHALFRAVDETTAAGLMAHHDIETGGLRSDVGSFYHENANITTCYMDSAAQKLYKVELSEGRFPQKEDELVVSEGMLKEFGVSADIGDTVTLPFQKYLSDGMDFAADEEFTICGFLPDNEASLKSHTYMALVSEEYLRNEIPKEDIRYRFLFRVADADRQTTDEIEAKISAIRESFNIPETDMNINKDYLIANHTDPAFFTAIAIILLVVTAAGIITIYSIYYVSMAQRVQEFGKLKAIGATKRQIRQIVLREGLCTACLAVPAGLVLSTLLMRPILTAFCKTAGQVLDSSTNQIYQNIIDSHEISLYRWEFYLFAAAATFITVYLSLFVPMRKAQRISPIEAMRYQGTPVKQTLRKGYTDLTISRLAKTSLTGNKKRSAFTILSMSITGILVVTVATVLSCANPKNGADNNIYGHYVLELNTESGNREHPEREWNNLIQKNPLTDNLKQQIERLDGVEKVVDFTWLHVETDLEGSEEVGVSGLLGLPESCFPELKKGIFEGDASWEELLSGDKIILNETIRRWMPELKVGDTFEIQTSDGSHTVTRSLEIIAIGDFPYGMVQHNFLLMAKEAADSLLPEDCTGYFHVFADQNYDKTLENNLKGLMGDRELLSMTTWKDEYELLRTFMTIMRSACTAFLAILSMICVMNLINTMVNSIHLRKKELGMMQAMGMTGSQLSKMLRLEGMFYTISTLFLSVGVGSILGYAAFLWAKKDGFLSVAVYHFPFGAVIIVIAVLTFVQLLLTALLGRSVRKESLIERIRFSE